MDILQATLSRETWRDDQQRCSECLRGNWAIWRCIDCMLSHPLCHHCMCHMHRHSPFHRIECWMGSYFRHAALWEVSIYILVEHHGAILICLGLQFQIEFLENLQSKKNSEEQLQLLATILVLGLATTSASHSATSSNLTSLGNQISANYSKDDINVGNTCNNWGSEKDNCCDWFNPYQHNHPEDIQDNPDNEFVDGQDDEEAGGAEADVHGFDPYLGTPQTSMPCDKDDEANADPMPKE